MPYKSLLVVSALAMGSAFVPAALSTAPASATVLAKGTCTPTGVAYIVSDYAATISTAFKNVPGTKVDFTQGGATASCVIVSFSAMALTVVSEYMQVIAKLDGSTDCTPSVNNTFAVGSPAFAAHAMNYVCPNVAPGPHFIMMRFLSGSGGSVQLANMTTLVHYRK